MMKHRIFEFIVTGCCMLFLSHAPRSAEVTEFTAQSRQATKYPVRFLSDRSQPLSILSGESATWHWLIDTSQPLRLWRGWWSLDSDGRMQEHAGGGSTIAEEGPLELVLEIKQTDDDLNLSLETRRLIALENDTEMKISKVAYKKTIPEKTDFTANWLRGTATLDGAHLTSLWEGKFLLEGKALKTVIIAVAADDAKSSGTFDIRPPGSYPDGAQGLPVIRLKTQEAPVDKKADVADRE